MLKSTTPIKVGAVICALYVILGAFGAHGLKPLLTDAQLTTYETGLRYMIIHGLGLILINVVYTQTKIYNKWPNLLFYIGIVLFSVSLIIHALKDIIGIEVNVFALFAPIGGLSFVAGWVSFAYTIRKI